ncbi:hypothetical protein GALMADRAFT_138573 [Galerina marginata CBS 339.88]|uniref:N-acetyltransferase domain-containing protein n=1 Tax=Galerina marginata (strain CBS 339.88) TaxID=685588 RepID=A0A067T2Y5_GALM3|nr:hypothetical protein GALMADRAFT_138573 [Galerina marginata CBS 339.88]
MASHLIDGQRVRIDRISVEQTLPLRHSVLWPDKPLSEVRLPEDQLGGHFGAFLPDQDDPIAVISLFQEDSPIDKDRISKGNDSSSYENAHEKAVRFRKFACAPQYQGKGLGTQLLAYALSLARSEQGAAVAWCDARTTSMDWYMKRGLLPFGATFFKGSVEYIRMRIDLRSIENAES